MTLLYIGLCLLAGALTWLLLLRLSDHWAERREWQRLLRLQPAQPAHYSPAMVASLPEPAQRFFNFAIAPGTPLRPVAVIAMAGEISLGTRAAPDYRAMRAEQILAAPAGFVWRLRLPGWVPVSGSDATRWTRFRIFGLIPVARLGGDPDHTRSAFGRYVAEALFWSPAALLPSEQVTWSALESNRVRVTVQHQGMNQSVDLSVNPEGQPVEVVFERWSNANPDKTYRLQPFGGRLSDFRQVQGFRVPFRVEAGNGYGTPDYFAFFRAQVNSIAYPAPEGSEVPAITDSHAGA